jgi:DNA-binding transcriptional ArsR family regulator
MINMIGSKGMSRQSSVHQLQLDEPEIHEITTIFKALADKSRLRIILVLTHRKKLCVSEIAELLGMSISSVSHHISKLEFLGFVEHQRIGKHVYHTLSDKCIVDILRRAKTHVHGD